MDKQPSSSNLAEISLVTNGVRLIFKWAKWLTPMQWLSYKYPLLKPRSDITPEEVVSKEFAKTRSRAIEIYMFGWWIVEWIFICISCIRHWPLFAVIIFMIPPLLRIIEIVQVTVNIVLFDALSGRPDDIVALRARIVVLSGFNYLELIVCFGIIYALNIELLHGAGNQLTAFYFSLITQLTIGYGDVFPIGWLRIVVAIHGIVSAFFVILIFGRFIASFTGFTSLFEDNKGSSKKEKTKTEKNK